MIDGYSQGDGSQHVNYIGQDGHVHELVPEPPAAVGSHRPEPSASGTGPRHLPLDGQRHEATVQQHVNYIGQDGHVHELVPTDTGGSGWTPT